MIAWAEAGVRRYEQREAAPARAWVPEPNKEGASPREAASLLRGLYLASRGTSWPPCKPAYHHRNSARCVVQKCGL